MVGRGVGIGVALSKELGTGKIEVRGIGKGGGADKSRDPRLQVTFKNDK